MPQTLAQRGIGNGEIVQHLAFKINDLQATKGGSI